MKTVKNIYHYVYDLGNLKMAIENAANDKKDRADVQRVLSDVDGYAKVLQNLLMNRKYKPGPYNEFIINKNKPQKDRVVSKPSFIDLVIQHAVVQVLMPIFTKGMYRYSCGSIPGRGNLYAKKTVEKWLRKDKKNTKYCLKMDIEKFYPSVNLGMMKNVLRKHIADYNMLWLLDTLIDIKDRGLALGHYTSPWFANLLLQDLDHAIKEKFGAKYYIRYMDDMIIFGPNKKKLHKIRQAISEFLKPYGLRLKNNWQVFKYGVKVKTRKGGERISRVLDFCGYRFYRTHTLLRKTIAKRFRRQLNRIAKRLPKKPTLYQSRRVMSYLSWTKHGNCYNYYQVNLQSRININILKGVIRDESKRRHKARAVPLCAQ
ncbi:MAG: hypothetical protein IJ168_09310 [Eubacterium sp.]|nr:hypothetical protein [Eubacterium sp.]